MAKPKKFIEQIEFIHPERPHNPNLPKNYYFDNDYVESLLTEYVRGGCTDLELRNKIMDNASELIRQIIRTHKLHLLTNGKEGTSFGDLYQIGWQQIESSLYKFDARPGHAKVFNLWCVSPDTILMTDKGLNTIGNCVGDDLFGIMSVNVYGLNGFNQATAYLKRPKSRTLRITTELGYFLECTPEHKILTTNGNWQQAFKLSVGDALPVQCGKLRNQKFEDKSNHLFSSEILLNRSRIELLNSGIVTRTVKSGDYYCLKPYCNDIFKTDGEIIWVPITAIEESESETIDIEVPETRSYNANGIIVSNSQVAKTVMLAYVKKESRDKRNSGSYKDHLEGKSKTPGYKLERFLKEAREVCKYDDTDLLIIDTIEEIFDNDPKPADKLIDKIVTKTQIPKTKVASFLRSVRLRSFEFTDSPVNQKEEQLENKYRVTHQNYDPEED